MVMEIGDLEGGRWTSTVPRPFAPAPGGGMGLGSTKWTSNVPHPFAPAPGGGVGGLGLISTLTERGVIASDQDPAVEVRAFAKGQTAILGPAFDTQLLPVLAKLGYQTGAPTRKTYPLTSTWIEDETSKGIFNAVVVNGSAGPFKDETLMFVIGAPDAQTTAELPKVGTAWNVVARPRDKVFNDGKLGILLDALRKAASGNQIVSGGGVQLQLRIFGVPKAAALPQPPPVDKPAPSPMLQAGVGVGIFWLAYNLFRPHIGAKNYSGPGWP